MHTPQVQQRPGAEWLLGSLSSRRTITTCTKYWKLDARLTRGEFQLGLDVKRAKCGMQCAKCEFKGLITRFPILKRDN